MYSKRCGDMRCLSRGDWRPAWIGRALRGKRGVPLCTLHALQRGLVCGGPALSRWHLHRRPHAGHRRSLHRRQRLLDDTLRLAERTNLLHGRVHLRRDVSDRLWMPIRGQRLGLRPDARHRRRILQRSGRLPLHALRRLRKLRWILHTLLQRREPLRHGLGLHDDRVGRAHLHATSHKPRKAERMRCLSGRTRRRFALAPRAAHARCNRTTLTRGLVAPSLTLRSTSRGGTTRTRASRLPRSSPSATSRSSPPASCSTRSTPLVRPSWPSGG